MTAALPATGLRPPNQNCQSRKIRMAAAKEALRRAVADALSFFTKR